MKALLTALSLLLLPCAAALSEDVAIVPNGDFSQGMEGWEVTMPPVAEAKTEIVPDGFEGKPCLKISIAGHEVESWQGRAAVTTNLEPGASYTMKVHLMCEPDDTKVEIIAWGRNAKDKDATLFGEREQFPISQTWEEFEYRFTTDANAWDKTGISFNNLARPYQNIQIANVVVTKD